MVQLRPAEVQVKAMPVIPKQFQVPPPPRVLPPLWACTSLVGLAMAVDLHCLVHR